MHKISFVAVLGLPTALITPSLHAEELKACPSPQTQTEIRDAAGSSIDALMNATEIVQKRFGAPHSRKRVSPNEVRLIYKVGRRAVSVSLSREGSRVAIDCMAY